MSQILCLLCCPPWPPKIAAKIAFKPPPPSYCFTVCGDRCEITMINNDSSWFAEWTAVNVKCLFATTSRGNQIACAYIKCSAKARYTFLISHGNASDLGETVQYYSALGNMIGCNIFCYDYSGYGASSGKPSEKNLYADIECAWDTMQTMFGIRTETIIAYGMSLGTVPTVDLASRRKVGGVVLHSPLMSALRLVIPSTQRTWCWDAFATIDKIEKIDSPVLVIHGTEDEVIPFSHGVTIYEKCRVKVSPLWVGGAGHNDIEAYSPYLERLKSFVRQELDQFNRASQEVSSNESSQTQSRSSGAGVGKKSQESKISRDKKFIDKCV